MKLRLLKDAPLKNGARVIVRADFDVEIRGRKILEPFRIYQCLPTLKYLLARKARIRILSHLGRPKGRRALSMSLKPIAGFLARALGRRVVFLTNPLSLRAWEKYRDSRAVIFFENLRFFVGEEKNDSRFAKSLARWGDLYINEAFAVSHRPHASIVGLARILPAYAGFQLEKEVRYLGRVLDGSRRSVVVIIGGAKTETKLPVAQNFLRSGAKVLVAGVPANTFFLAAGKKIGKSLADKEFAPRLRKLLNHPRLMLPLDSLWSKEAIVDIGPQTLSKFLEAVRGAKTILWNGPLGYTPKFSRGTLGFARGLKRIKGLKIVGGGDILAVLEKHRLLGVFDHVSTGGGAMLEFLAGKKLPGIEVLRR